MYHYTLYNTIWTNLLSKNNTRTFLWKILRATLSAKRFIYGETKKQEKGFFECKQPPLLERERNQQPCWHAVDLRLPINFYAITPSHSRARRTESTSPNFFLVSASIKFLLPPLASPYGPLFSPSLCVSSDSFFRSQPTPFATTVYTIHFRSLQLGDDELAVLRFIAASFSGTRFTIRANFKRGDGCHLPLRSLAILS